MQQLNTLNVSQSQLDACERITDLNRNQVFYLVESQSRSGTHYKVIFDREHKGLRCLPHDGEACPASLQGLTCWHMKAAYAHAQLLREEHKGQSEIERYVRQGVDREISMRVVYSKPVEYSELEVKRAQSANQARPFSILR